MSILNIRQLNQQLFFLFICFSHLYISCLKALLLLHTTRFYIYLQICTINKRIEKCTLGEIIIIMYVGYNLYMFFFIKNVQTRFRHYIIIR